MILPGNYIGYLLLVIYNYYKEMELLVKHYATMHFNKKWHLKVIVKIKRYSGIKNCQDTIH